MKFKNMEPWQKKKLVSNFLIVLVIGVIFLSYTTTTLYQDKMGEEYYWNNALTVPSDIQSDVDKFSTNAVRVETGTYVTNLKEVNLKGSNFRVSFLLWFKWKGNDDLDMKNNFRVYKGYMNKMEVIKDEKVGDMNYQQVRCDVTVTKEYWTVRFPLESHQLRVYVESNYLVDEVLLIPDTEASGINPNLGIAGYEIDRHATGSYAIRYNTNFSDPKLPEDGNQVSSEHVTALQINRTDAGLYIKCIVALVGTLTWVLITLYICTYHYVDPLSMIPAALFGTVANVMVGANLLPDALQAGLVEYVNFWGVSMILMAAVVIININRIRKKFEDKDFSKTYGRVMFFTLLTYVLAGNILMPICAFMF